MCVRRDCAHLAFVSPTRPCFEATYGAFRADPTRPCAEDMLIILPHPGPREGRRTERRASVQHSVVELIFIPRSLIPGSASLVVWNAADRLTAKT